MPTPQAIALPKPTEWALQLAAQAWCEPTTSSKVMDIELATVFAQQLTRLAASFESDRAARAQTPGDLAEFDQAIAAELPCVSVVPYNSHEICKWFAKNVRERLAASLTPGEPAGMVLVPREPTVATHQEAAGYRHWWRMSPGTQVAVVSGLADPGATDPYGGTSGVFERTEPLGVLQAQHQPPQQGEAA